MRHHELHSTRTAHHSLLLRIACAVLGTVIATGCQDSTPPHPTALVPEQPNRSTSSSPEAATAPDSDWVRTPTGEFHRSCVHYIPDGAVVDGDTVRFRDGRVSALPVCLFAPRLMTIPLDMLPEASRSGIARRPTIPALNANGWVERVWARSGPYKGLSADWKVPNAPGPRSYVNNGMTFFTFPGLMNSSWILQPVLQFGRAQYFVADYWTVQSYRCNDFTCDHGSPIRVTTGDVIHGDVSASNCSSNQCLWTVTTRDVSTGQASTLLVNDTPNYETAISGVAEQYGISFCNDLPGLTGNYLTSGVFYTSVAVRDASGNPTTPPWTQLSGSPPCLSSIAFSATAASLRQSPQFTAGIDGPFYLNRYQSGMYSAWLTYGAGPYQFQWRTRTSGNVPPSPYGWTDWTPWYFTGSTNYTFYSTSSCGVKQVDLQLMVTDMGDNGGAHTAAGDKYITINNPC